MRQAGFAALLAVVMGCNGSVAPTPTPASKRGAATQSAIAAAQAATHSQATSATRIADERTPPSPIPVNASTRPGDDWPRFLGPTGDGVSTETGIVRPWPATGLKVVWQKPIGLGYPAPSISKGRLFHFDRHGDKARLNCWQSESGEPIWQFEYATDYEDHYGYNNGPRCCPVVDDDRVYIFGPEGMLHCVRVEDGQLVWKVDTKAEFGVVQNFFGVGSTPAIEGDLLIVQVGGSPPGTGNFPALEQKGNGSGVVAFDKRTGKVRYRLSDELASFASPVFATIEGRRWCFVFARGGLLGFDPGTGKLDFHYPWRAKDLESAIAANPVVVKNQVFITEAYGPGSSLLEVRPGGYKVLWTDADKGRRKSLQAHWVTPIYHDGYLYGDSSRHSPEAELRCVELATGKVTWREPDNGHTSLLMVDGHFVGLTEYGELLLIKVNPQKYEEVSRFDLFTLISAAPKDRRIAARNEYPWWAAPVLSHGLLYVRSSSHLLCLELIPDRK